MSGNQTFWCGAGEEKPVVREAKEMVRWAAEPVLPGESIKTQISNASNALRLDFGTTRRAWYGIAGPDIYPTIYNAWLDLVQRRAAEIERQQRSPWAATAQAIPVVNEFHEPIPCAVQRPPSRRRA